MPRLAVAAGVLSVLCAPAGITHGAGGAPDAPIHSATTVLMARLPARAERACAALQRRVKFRVLCPRALPRAVVGWPGQPPPAFVATLVRRSPTRYTGIDFAYGAPWEGTGWRRHRWRNRPCCFLHFVVERLEGDVPRSARPRVLGGRHGRLLPAGSETSYGGAYFANHVRFFFRDRRTDYVATLHSFGNRETTALLGRIVATLHAGPFRIEPAPGIPLHEPRTVTPVAGGVWTTSTNPDRAVRVDGHGRIADAIRVRLVPFDVTEATRALWVAGDHPAAVRRIDPKSGAVLATISTGTFPKAVAARGRAVWVLNSAPFHRRGSIVRLDSVQNRVSARIPLGRAPTRLAVGPRSVWITDMLEDTLTRIDRRTLRVAARIRVGRAPYGVVLGARSAWVTNSDDGTVSRVDPATNRVVATIRVGRNPYGIAFGRSAVWVANLGSGTVSRIDPETNRAARWARVGGDPFAIALSAGSLWVTLYGDGILRRLPLRG